jgi:phage-related protein
LYIAFVLLMKDVGFCGTALDDLRAFPVAARREAGHQIDQVQHGRNPRDWKPMKAVGPGVREIRIRDEAGAFRVVYVANFADAVGLCAALLSEESPRDQQEGPGPGQETLSCFDGGPGQ